MRRCSLAVAIICIATISIMAQALAAKDKSKTVDPSVAVTGIEITRFGIYDAETKTRTINEEAGKPVEQIELKYCNFKKEENKIDAKVGTYFGFEYVLKGVPIDKYVVLTLRDIIRSDEMEVYESKTEEVAQIGHTKLVAYRFRNNADLFTGTWTFQLMYNERKLAEKTFQIEIPE